MAGQCRIFDHTSTAPYRRNEIVLRDDTITVLDQANQQIEHLRFDGNRLGTMAQLAPIGVKYMIGEEKLHAAASGGLLAHSSCESDRIVASEGASYAFPHLRVVSALRTGRRRPCRAPSAKKKYV